MPRTKRKHMRLPNGFGSITKVTSKHLRKPYLARVTVGKRDDGRPILKALKPPYYETYNDAYKALLSFHENPYDLAPSVTVKALYERWSSEYFTHVSKAACRTIAAAWRYCGELYDVAVKDVRPRHIKHVMEHGSAVVRGEVKHPSANIKRRIKSLFNLLLDYAMEYEIVTVNYARTFDVSDKIIKDAKTMHNAHMIFTSEERRTLWGNVSSEPYVDMILIQSYSGWRPQELCKIRTEDVDLSKWTFTGGMKTQAGAHRTVPIHTCIRDLVKKRYNKNNEFLFVDEKGLPMTYDKYRHRFDKVMVDLKLDPNHRPHDPRKTFVTMCKNAGVNEYAIKKMVGHQVSDITEAIYTERPATFLTSELSKVYK